MTKRGKARTLLPVRNRTANTENRKPDTPGKTGAASSRSTAARSGRKRTRAGGNIAKAYLLLSIIALLLLSLLFLLPGRDTERSIPAAQDDGSVPSERRQPADAPERTEPDQKADDMPSGEEDSRDRSPERQEPEKPAPVAPVVPRKLPDPPVPPLRVNISIVIDDVGYNLHQLEPFLEFPGPITFAVLPGLPYTQEAVRRIREAGKDVIIHFPMEAVGGSDPGPGAVFRSMTDEEILAVTLDNLNQLPEAVGINNHQGSAITADERVMKLILGALRDRGLFFLDSLTTAGSVGRRVSEAYQLQYLERTVFLDNDKSREAILESLSGGIAKARKQGHAVMIGHVWSSELAQILIEMYPFMLDEGFDLSYLPELLKEDVVYRGRP